ncbi:acetylornithine deacetylase [Actibacterium atlanticum]|uniref:Acetylornithine deacetylase n=1 Tax=Actibacterium atlanticum TaxID=1461693 RepID=A0A058ZPR3_9RHOB|nr:acetylornithine deacetylase [Actibacterium atlanticum]KCV83147.1 acetylornithine deacetylase [Actibacterium atlanticum]
MTAELTPRQIMERLVAFPTVSKDSNLALVDWVEGYLADFGIAAKRVVNAQYPGKVSLYAHVGPRVEGGVVLSGHSDVVPVEGQDWTSDPWTVDERDGKLFGRGCVDMKGFDALSIWTLVRAHREGVNRPLQLALSHDEEIGCAEAAPLIEAMAKDADLPRASTVLVGEPSNMQVVTGHKGGLGFKLRLKGHEVHSSLLHTGVNAIMQGARLIDWVNQVNAQNASASPAAGDAEFVPPWTSLHVGTIRGGTAHNITAGECVFGIDFRFVPGDDPMRWRSELQTRVALVEADMKAVHPGCAIELTETFNLPALKPETDGAAETLARRLTGDNASHVVSYGTEAGYFQQGGYSAVICGPGSIEQAHQPDEYITLEQFQAGHDFMARLLQHLQE